MDYSKVFLLLIILVLIAVAVMYYQDSEGLVHELGTPSPRDLEAENRAALGLQEVKKLQDQSINLSSLSTPETK
jgi:hypothetical protein